MQLLRYKLSSGTHDGWQFDEVAFARVNLLVGDSATGKSRFLNTIVNFTKQIVSDTLLYEGDWDTDVSINGKVYNYKLLVQTSPSRINQKEVVNEELIWKDNNQVLARRDRQAFHWKDIELPKLSTNISAISLLKDEPEIRDLYNGFRRIVARRFYGTDLSNNFQFGALAPDAEKQLLAKKDVQLLLAEPMDFHNRMNLLKALDSNMYHAITDLYKQAFPFISETTIHSFSQVFESAAMPLIAPVFCIKEKNINDWVPVNDISSGMQKLFLLILDLFLMRDSGILLIDEYENSLGVNAINFLPDLIYSISDKCQFIITSHHPYIINNIPIEDWHIFHRKGLSVRIKSGREVKEKYKGSKQEQFTQLLNDPFYTDGIE